MCFVSNYLDHYNVAFVEIRGLSQSLEFILSTHMLMNENRSYRRKLAIFIVVWTLQYYIFGDILRDLEIVILCFLAQNWQLRLLKFETMDLHVSHCLQKQSFSINYTQYNALDEYLIKKNVNKISFIF